MPWKRIAGRGGRASAPRIGILVAPNSTQESADMRRSELDSARSARGALCVQSFLRVAMKPFFLCLHSALVFACLSLPQPEEAGGTAAAVRAAGAAQEPRGKQDLLERAEARYREKSYALAHELYTDLAKLELAPAERAWVEFRLSDTRWRSAAQSNDPDASELDKAAHDLRAMLERYERPESRDDLFAEIHESLGDGTW